MIGTAVCTSSTHPLHLQPNGTVTMTYPAGSDTVASLQPDGTLATRPAGTAGPWECASRVPGGLLFRSFTNAALFVPYFDV
jgi:hypothetical protein